jgi:3-(methylthio)propionyl---CoA ligase
VSPFQSPEEKFSDIPGKNAVPVKTEKDMRGLMMETPLLVSSIIRHAAVNHGSTEIVSQNADGSRHRYTYSDAHRRSCQLANALTSLGVSASDTVATLAWNSYRHFEAYYGISGFGAVCHTINPRLFHEQIVYIVNHADDRYVLFDPSFIGLVEEIAGRCPHVEGWVAMCDLSGMPDSPLPNVLCYDELIGAECDSFDWPRLDENQACGLCYTSGTTGHPKGVLYSHRSTVLHAMASALPDAMDLSARDTVMPVSSMFHVMAWGLPYSAALVGAKLVLPGPKLDGASLYRLLEAEGVTISGGVPTIWLGLIGYMQQNSLRLSSLERVLVGGAACPRSVIATLEDDFGVEVVHAWGMTETSPVGTLNRMKSAHAALTTEQRHDLQVKQGRGIFGVEMKIVDSDGTELPWDGKTFGDLMVRGPWICRSYHKQERIETLNEGWFSTGDVATIDADGYMQITDRSKDLIKSGGEWISSIELENLAIGHPAVQEAAVIGVPHPKWTERPLLVVVTKPGATVTREELLGFYEGKVVRWWLPDDVVFVNELPHTATGKLLKTKLREEYRSHQLPTV